MNLKNDHRIGSDHVRTPGFRTAVTSTSVRPFRVRSEAGFGPKLAPEIAYAEVVAGAQRIVQPELPALPSQSVASLDATRSVSLRCETRNGAKQPRGVAGKGPGDPPWASPMRAPFLEPPNDAGNVLASHPAKPG